MYTCDRCKEEVPAVSGHGWSEDSPPIDWAKVEVKFQHAGKPDWKYDLCKLCTEQVQHLIGEFVYQECWTGKKQ